MVSSENQVLQYTNWVIKCSGNTKWQPGSLATLSVPSGQGLCIVHLCITWRSLKTVLFTWLALVNHLLIGVKDTLTTLSRERLQNPLMRAVKYTRWGSGEI